MSKILVVDDEKIMLMLARRILSKKYEVITAMSATEAIELFETERPDLVLSDLMMPEMDGYEFHRVLQEKNSETVPIIFMTADESNESETRVFNNGAMDFIRKPFHPDVLLRRVGNIIENLDKIQGLTTAASVDPMTGLLNKSESQRQIGDLIKKSPGALLMLDLDSFKLVNDIHGHDMGDKILIRFAELIRKIIRENDLAGRMGGDEFIVYLQHVHDEEILQEKAKFLNDELLLSAKKFMGEDMNIPLGVSVGAVFSPDEGKDFSTLYKKADSALYEVKKNGKHGCAVYKENNLTEENVSEGAKFSRMSMILGERNVERGAYFVDFETFKKIYQFSARIADNYNKSLDLLQFTLADENFADEFKEILIHSLRKSDCVTQSDKNKFLVILIEASLEKCNLFCDRIFSKIENNQREKISIDSERIHNS